MISSRTWPNFRRGTDKDGTRVIIDEVGAGSDVQYGKTKIFIRSPQTLFELEKRRTDTIPSICVTLQKVGLILALSYLLFIYLFIHSFIHSFIHLFIYLSIYLFIYLCIYLSIYLSIYLFIY